MARSSIGSSFQRETITKSYLERLFDFLETDNPWEDCPKPKSIHDVKDIIKFRHDLIHSEIQNTLNQEFGEKSLSVSLVELNVGIDTKNPPLVGASWLNKTPDIVRVLPVLFGAGYVDTIQILDVACSSDSDTVRVLKERKYEPCRQGLLNYLRESGNNIMIVSFVPLVFPESANEDIVIGILESASVDVTCAPAITRIINSFYTMISIHRNDARLNKLYNDVNKKNDIEMKFTVTIDDVINQLRSMKNPPISVEDYIDRVNCTGIYEGYDDEELNALDQEALEILTEIILQKQEVINMRSEMSMTMHDVAKMILKKVSLKFRASQAPMGFKKIIPVPLTFERTIVKEDCSIAKIRRILSSLNDDDNYDGAARFWRAIRRSTNNVNEYEFSNGREELTKKGTKRQVGKHILTIITDEKIKEYLLVSGIGRKSFLKNKNFKHSDLREKCEISARKHDNRQMDPMDSDAIMEGYDMYLKNISRINICKASEVSYDCSTIPGINRSPADAEIGSDISRITSTLAYKILEYLERIFEEVALNAKRKRRVNESIICSPDDMDVLICIHEGGEASQLGKGFWISMAGTAKIEENEFYPSCNYEGDIFFSKPRYVKTEEIEHYLRVKDKFVCGAAALMSSDSEILDNNTDALGLLSSILSELSKPASKILQDSRYFGMQALSIYKRPKALGKMFDTPYRSLNQLRAARKLIEFSQKVEGNVDFILGSTDEDNELDIKEDLSGSKLRVPRILSSGPKYKFQSFINEFYYCNGFSKDIDDKAQSAMQILVKMSTAQELYMENCKKQDFDKDGMGYERCRTREEKKEYLRKWCSDPGQHHFVARFIRIGSILYKKKMLPGSDMINYYRTVVNKSGFDSSVDALGTFKSSLKGIIESVDVDALENEEDFPKFCKRLRECGLGNRSKCFQFSIETMEELKKHNLMQCADLLIRNLETVIQIFKKNQIGSVREILILKFKSRLCINIIEKFCRAACSLDPGEKLTNSKDKVKYLGSVMNDLSRNLGGVIFVLMHFNWDMTKWCEGFQPWGFSYNHTGLRRYDEGLAYFFDLILLKHCCKKVELPAEYVAQVILNREKTFDESEEVKRFKKRIVDSYEEGGKLLTHFMNEINMGQGILHYESSLQHGSKNALREEMMKRIMSEVKFNKSLMSTKECYSSDDGYDGLGITVSAGKIERKMIVEMFLESSYCCARVCNIQPSPSKSSLGNLYIGEFNSNFISGNHIVSPVLKFMLSAPLMVNTNSPVSMINSYYSMSKQILAQGGSAKLAQIALIVNRDYFERVYKTGKGGINSFMSQFKEARETATIDTGHFNIAPAHYIHMGPDLVTYHQFSEGLLSERSLNGLNKALRYNMREGKLNEKDEAEPRSSRIEITESISQILIKKRAMISEMGYDKEWLEDMIDKNPIALITTPRTTDEAIMKVVLKLYSPGASEAMKQISSLLYHLRSSSTVESKIFSVGQFDKMPFYVAQMALCQKVDGLTDLNKEHFLNMKVYEDALAFKKIHITAIKDRNEFMPRKVRKIMIRDAGAVLKLDLKDILRYYWYDDQSCVSEDDFRSLASDVERIKLKVPSFSTAGLDESLVGERTTSNRRQFVMNLYRIFGTIKSQFMPAFLYGPDNREVAETMDRVIRLNLTDRKVFTYSFFKNTTLPCNHNYLKQILNFFSMQVGLCHQRYSAIPLHEDILRTAARNTMRASITISGVTQEVGDYIKRNIHELCVSLATKQDIRVFVVFLSNTEISVDEYSTLLEDESFTTVTYDNNYKGGLNEEALICVNGARVLRAIFNNHTKKFLTFHSNKDLKPVHLKYMLNALIRKTNRLKNTFKPIDYDPRSRILQKKNADYSYKFNASRGLFEKNGDDLYIMQNCSLKWSSSVQLIGSEYDWNKKRCSLYKFEAGLKHREHIMDAQLTFSGYMSNITPHKNCRNIGGISVVNVMESKIWGESAADWDKIFFELKQDLPLRSTGPIPILIAATSIFEDRVNLINDIKEKHEKLFDFTGTRSMRQFPISQITVGQSYRLVAIQTELSPIDTFDLLMTEFDLGTLLDHMLTLEDVITRNSEEGLQEFIDLHGSNENMKRFAKLCSHDMNYYYECMDKLATEMDLRNEGIGQKMLDELSEAVKVGLEETGFGNLEGFKRSMIFVEAEDEDYDKMFSDLIVCSRDIFKKERIVSAWPEETTVARMFLRSFTKVLGTENLNEISAECFGLTWSLLEELRKMPDDVYRSSTSHFVAINYLNRVINSCAELNDNKLSTTHKALSSIPVTTAIRKWLQIETFSITEKDFPELAPA